MAVLAASGHGKSWVTQALIEKNRPNYEYGLILDFKDEFRGLVSKQHGPGLAKHWIAGERELEHFTPDHYDELLRRNKWVVLAKHSRIDDNEDWRSIAADAITAARRRGDVLVVLDEAHRLAPQDCGYPDAISGLATTGRGEVVSSISATQRPASFDNDFLGNQTARFIGGFTYPADINAFKQAVEYPVDVHKVVATDSTTCPTTC
ncbi:hypothetical protein [Halomarina oriensis]|uniref:ATP-binding protein n=1 Tax=Halomarina oriensis TaxID=671145 RepID=A0A6B0GG06_9EURY|nr:hypothetical protein [Halomarina oriensis]MWG32967.1 hypothetical protein [Halomarina oriensis]